MVGYEKIDWGHKLAVYKYDDNGKVIDIVEILPCPEWEAKYEGCLRVDTVDPELGYQDSTFSSFEEFGVNSFEELKQLSIKDLVEMIWGE